MLNPSFTKFIEPSVQINSEETKMDTQGTTRCKDFRIFE